MQIGIDLGATKIEYVLLDNNNSEILRQRKETPKNYKKLLELISNIINNLSKKYNEKLNVGICHPGSMDLKGKVFNTYNMKWIKDKKIKYDLTSIIPNKVIFENDANCFAFSEAIDGVAKDYNSVFGIILGSGTGGGFVINKKIIKGANHIAGEWGHNFLPGYGINEKKNKIKYNYKFSSQQFISGKGLEKLFKENYKINKTAHQILNNKKNKKFISSFKDRLARSLASVINILDPEIIIFGGGLSNEIKNLNEIKTICQKYLEINSLNTIFSHPAHGDSSGVRGAAILSR
tara:strand:+ start:2357 stop:3229 length:873 start_codon:yes stop_codon:yes gene_type:complete